MPIYEYQCSNCGCRFAVLEPLGSPDTGRECPKCGGRDTRRVISSFSSGTSHGSSPGGCRPGG